MTLLFLQTTFFFPESQAIVVLEVVYRWLYFYALFGLTHNAPAIDLGKWQGAGIGGGWRSILVCGFFLYIGLRGLKF